MTDRWDTDGTPELPRDERTVLIPAVGDEPPDPPELPSTGRPVLPWAIAAAAVLVALIVGFVALRDDDGERLATKTGASGDQTTTTTADGKEGEKEKGEASPTGDTTPVDKPGNPSPTTTASTSTTEPTTTSSETTTTTTAPTTPMTLNFSLPAVYGSSALTSGFVPDPFTVGVTAGGPSNVSYLGGGCSGHATSAPTFSVNYTAGALPTLRFYFIGAGDTTLIINSPSGSFRCGDDSFGTINPTIDFSTPSSGRYDIWVATYAAGASVSGTLYITENTANHP